MEPETQKQPELFPSPQAPTAPEPEPAVVEEKPEEKPLITKDEILATKPTIPIKELDSKIEAGLTAQQLAQSTLEVLADRKVCADVNCKQEIFPGDETLYGGQYFHKECAPFLANNLQANPRIEVKLSIRMSDLAKVVEIIELDESLKAVHDSLADVLTEHGSYYIRCSECGKVILKHKAIIGGEHTREVRKSTGVITAIPSGKFFSKVRSIDAFCSPGHDLNYSKKIQKAYDEEQAKRASRSSSTKEGGEKKETGKKDVLAALLKLAAGNPELTKDLTKILASLKLDAAAKGAGKK